MASSGARDVLRMRVDLHSGMLEEPPREPGVAVRTFKPDDAEPLHSLLLHGYRRGGGTVAEFSRWLPAMMSDKEYDPALWFLAEAEGVLVGAILCWTSGFIKDLVVRESWRHRGLGEALIRHVFAVFVARGTTHVELKVHADNAVAIRLYERMGMRVVERIAVT